MALAHWQMRAIAIAKIESGLADLREAEAAQGAAPRQKSIEELAAEKGIGPIKSTDDLRIHGITDEEADAFIEAMESEGAAPRAEGLDAALADWADDFDEGWGDLFASDDFDEGGYTLLDHGSDHARKEFRLLRIWRSRPSDEQEGG